MWRGFGGFQGEGEMCGTIGLIFGGDDTRDVWGVVTHTDYDVANRPTQSTVFINTGVWSRTSPTYATTGGGTNGVVTQRWSNAAATVTG